MAAHVAPPAAVTRATAARAVAPGPRGSLVMGNIAEYMRDPIAMLMRARREYGDVVRNPLGPYLTHLVAHPDHVRHVLQVNYANYVRGRFYDNFKPFFGEGLLTTDGDFWLRHRRLVQPLFHRRPVEQSSRLITDSVAALLDRWEPRAGAGAGFDIVPEMMWLTLSVLGKSIFGVDVARFSEAIAPAVQYGVAAMMPQGNINDFLPRWLPTPRNRRIERARRTLAGIMQWVREERRGIDGEADDLTSLLRRGSSRDAGASLSDQEIEDEMMTIFLAGHETTGSGLAWALYALATHGDVRDRLEHELAAVLDGRPPSADDLPRLPYLVQVIDECLRVYPPIWGFTRDAAGDDEIGGYRIPKGSSIFVSPYVTHRHPEFWDDPERFDPGRFAPAQAAARPRFAYFPFGGGPRQCIGLHMARLQMQLAVAMVLQRYRLAVVPGHPIERGANVSLRPVHGIRVTLERQPPSARRRLVATGAAAAAAAARGCPFAGQV